MQWLRNGVTVNRRDMTGIFTFPLYDHNDDLELYETGEMVCIRLEDVKALHILDDHYAFLISGIDVFYRSKIFPGMTDK